MAVHQLPRALTLAAAALLSVTACQKSDGGTKLGPNVSTTRPTIGGPIGQADAAECRTQRDTMEEALVAYEALIGKPAATETDLVTAGVVHEQSAFYDVRDGTLVLAANSPCPLP